MVDSEDKKKSLKTTLKCVQTTLGQITAHLGAKKVLSLLEEGGITQSQNSCILLVSSIGGDLADVDVDADADAGIKGTNNVNVSASASAGQDSPSLKSLKRDVQIQALVTEITSSRDKRAAIRKLYAICKSHPEVYVDIIEGEGDHLSSVSSTFQRFIRDQLASLARSDRAEITDIKYKAKVQTVDVLSDVQYNQSLLPPVPLSATVSIDTNDRDIKGFQDASTAYTTSTAATTATPITLKMEKEKEEKEEKEEETEDSDLLARFAKLKALARRG